jgi:exosome complex component RRP4
MGKLITKDKTIVIPGEVLAEGMDYVPGPGTYRDDQNIYAKIMGLASIAGRTIKLIPLSGRYSPKSGDTIICRVKDVTFSGWMLDTNCAYQAMLGMKDATSDYIQRGADLRKYYDLEDYLVCNIINVTTQKLIDVTMKGPGLVKLKGGRIVEVNPHKVPRIIGKQGSMVSMIKQATGCRITVGQNGLVWVSGEPNNELIVVEAIKQIEENSHLAGLTDKIKAFLEKKTGKKLQGEQL